MKTKNIKYYEDENYQGVDADLETSLFEYGLIWKQEGDDYLFVYAVGSNADMNYSYFDHAHIAIKTNPEKEWDWADFDKVAECAGYENKQYFLQQSLPSIIFDMINYYGHENVFGGSYYPYEITNN